MIELEKDDIKNLVSEIERAVVDKGVAGFSHIDFKDYESHKTEIEKQLAEKNLLDSVKIEYRGTGIAVDFIR